MKTYNIDFNYQTDFKPLDELSHAEWINTSISLENFITGDISYVFCSDDDLLKINQSELNHDYLTDIITFDLSMGKLIAADLFISVDRVRDNAQQLDIPFEEELRRVMIHGILHCMGYNDKSSEEASLMRSKEEEKMKLFHVEHNA
jgi:rRNA maturation RNase YbeY